MFFVSFHPVAFRCILFSMTLARAVAINTIVQIVGKAISVALGVVVIGMMTRYLGAQGFGHYSTILAFLQIFGILVDFGLTLATAQLLAGRPADAEKTLGAMLGLRIVTAALFLGIAPVAALFFPYPAVVKVGILILSFHFFAISIQQVLLGVFQTHLRMDLLTVAELVGRALLVIGVAVTIVFHQTLAILLFAIVVATVFQLGVAAVLAHRLVPLRPRIDLAEWKAFARLSWPVGVGIALNLLYLKGDTLILSLVRPAEEVGLYGAPYRVLEILVVLPSIFIGLVFPLWKTAWTSQRARFPYLVQQSFDAMAILTIPIVCGGFVLATPLMVFIAGPAFVGSGALLRILILATGCIFFGTLFGHAIVAIDHQRAMLWGYGATAIIALAGYVVFIPRFGGMGAAWMTLVAEALILFLTAVATLRATHISISLGVTLRALVAGGVMVAVLLFFPAMHVLLAVVVGAVIYTAALAVLGGIPLELRRALSL